MQITPLGAARTVTGSAYLVENEAGECFLVDCGMFQGGRRIETRNRDSAPYRPGELKGIVITHAHIDHSGLVPRLVRQGYQGPVYASRATCELLKILWADSAHIQEMEARWQSRKNKRAGKKGLDPLYEGADAEAATRLLRPLEMDQESEITPWARVMPVGAGHILGATSLLVTLRRRGRELKVGFSGDVGRPRQLIVPDPERLPQPDVLFMETTYGGRLHKSLDRSQEELVECVQEAYRQGGKVLIPAFAVERTQEIIYTLAAAYRRGQMPEDMPVFLDSPLAIRATAIFREFPDFFDQETKDILDRGQTPLNLPNLKPTLSTEESQAINEHKGPAVIIAGNGMASAGRIKHHLKHNLWKPTTQVVIVGFQAKGTTGRLLVEGATRVKIFREEVAVRAKVATIGGFSAHADQRELLEWLEPLARPGLRVNLIHGEESSSLAFKAVAQKRFPGLRFSVPRAYKAIPLAPAPARPLPAPAPAPAPAAPQVQARLQSLQARLERLARRLQEPGLEQEERMDILSRLEAAERLMAGEEAA